MGGRGGPGERENQNQARGPGKCHRERFRRKDLGHKYVTRTFAADTAVTPPPRRLCTSRGVFARGARGRRKLDDNDYDWLPFIPPHPTTVLHAIRV